MVIKALEVSLGQVGALGTLDPSTVGVPVVVAGQVLATGYYTVAGQQYYYNASLDQWYVVVAGYLYPLAISWQPSPSTKLELTEKETLRFRLQFYYLGPVVTRTFYAALGENRTSGSFGEWFGCNVSKSIALPACSVKTLFTDKYVDLVMPDWSWWETWGHAGEDFAAYVKIMNGLTLTEGVNCSPYYYNVGRVIAKKGEFSEFGITKFEKAA